ncbi:MAG: hypothetical protein ACOYUZ_03100 [Patescibacteria group bacterium]
MESRQREDLSRFRVQVKDVVRANLARRGNAMTIQDMFAAEKQYVLFLTPQEKFVWEALLASIKISDAGEIRIPIPKTEDAMLGKWNPKKDMFKPDELEGVIERFIAVNILDLVGESGNGHNTYRMIRHPGSFLVVPIKKRPVEIVKSAWIQAIRSVQCLPSHMLRQANCRKQIAVWVNLQNPEINASSANVMLFGYRTDPPAAGEKRVTRNWGILMSNPDVNTNNSAERAKYSGKVYFYLIAYPGFEAYCFADKNDPNRVSTCDEPYLPEPPPPPSKPVPALVAQEPAAQQAAEEPAAQTLPPPEPPVDDEVKPHTEHDNEKPMPEIPSAPQPPKSKKESKSSEENPYPGMEDDELEAAVRRLVGDIKDIKNLLEETQENLRQASGELTLRYDERRKAAERTAAELEAKLKELDASLKSV